MFSSENFILQLFYGKLQLTSRYKNVVHKRYSKCKTGQQVTAAPARLRFDVAVLLLRLLLRLRTTFYFGKSAFTSIFMNMKMANFKSSKNLGFMKMLLLESIYRCKQL